MQPVPPALLLPQPRSGRPAAAVGLWISRWRCPRCTVVHAVVLDLLLRGRYRGHARPRPWPRPIDHASLVPQLQTGFYLCGKPSHFLHWTKTKKGVQVVFLAL